MGTIWIVDDDLDILDVISQAFELNDFFNFKIVDSLNKFMPSYGDIVVHDVIGVGELKKIEGVKYFSHSGNYESKPDFAKPDSTFTMIDKLIEVYNGK